MASCAQNNLKNFMAPIKTVLINPNLVVQYDDPFTTGIVYMPIGLAYVASALREQNFAPVVIDAFAEKPHQGSRWNNYLLLGLSADEILSRIPRETHAIFVYAINLNNHLSTLEIVRAAKKSFPSVPIIILENTQSVTGYSLSQVSHQFYESGADYILTGQAESRCGEILAAVCASDFSTLKKIPGLGAKDFYNPVVSATHDLDALSFPAWDLFPLENYWRLGFAHGPLTSKKYLPLLTSRGCPYPCRFCVIPSTNNLKWLARSAKNVVDEIEYSIQKYGVHEFHVEDLDPTVNDERTREICREILKRQLKITWKIVAGTKAETIRDEETLTLMAQSGCRYISISPETGSARILKAMNKPFNIDHALKLITVMKKLKIFSQACFVLGYPSETDEDRKATQKLIERLTRLGVDEIALFVITPVPGSAIYKEFSGYKNIWELTFTPTWREDFQNLQYWRLKLYRTFLLEKLWFFPFKIIRQIFNFLTHRFETKMEMVPYRALVWRKAGIFARPFKN